MLWGRDGHQRPVAFSSQPVILDGAFAGAIVVLRDLRENRAQVEAVLARLPVGIMLGDGSPGRVDLTNERLAELFGIDPRARCQLQRVQDWPMYHLDGRAVSPEDHPLHRALRSGEQVRAEKYRIRLPDSHGGNLSAVSSPVAYDSAENAGPHTLHCMGAHLARDILLYGCDC